MSQLTLAHLKQIIEGTVPEFSPRVYIRVPVLDADGNFQRYEIHRAIGCEPGKGEDGFAVFITASEEDIRRREKEEAEPQARAKRKRGWIF